ARAANRNERPCARDGPPLGTQRLRRPSYHSLFAPSPHSARRRALISASSRSTCSCSSSAASRSSTLSFTRSAAAAPTASERTTLSCMRRNAAALERLPTWARAALVLRSARAREDVLAGDRECVLRLHLEELVLPGADDLVPQLLRVLRLVDEIVQIRAHERRGPFPQWHGFHLSGYDCGAGGDGVAGGRLL